MPRALYAVAAFLVLVLFASLLGALGVPKVINGLTAIVTEFQGIITAMTRGVIGDSEVTLLGEPMNADQLAGAVAAGVRDWLGSAGRLAALGAAGFATFIGVILTFVLLFYFLFSGPSVARGMLALVPRGQRPARGYAGGPDAAPLLYRRDRDRRLCVGCSLRGARPRARHPARGLALLTGLLEMIPMIGPIAAAVIAGLVAVRYATGIGPIIAYTVYAIALRVSIDQILAPIVLGSAARVHPVVIIFCFLAGGVLFGIVGIILAVPAALVVRTSLAILYDEPREVPGRQ